MSVVRWTIGLAIMAYCAAPAMAQSSIQTAFNYNLQDESDSAPPAPGAPQSEMEDAAPERSDGGYEDGQSACGCESDQSCGGECGCDTGCCDSCGNGGYGNCLGDAWVLKDCLTPGCCNGPNYGGWISMGYYNHNERLSTAHGDELSFNDAPHNLNFDQVWFYVDKVAEAGACSADYGYRFDVMYGAHGHAAQAYGNDGGTWDVTFDHGYYEWALPQAYAEVAYGDWSFKVGKWFTPVGYEVIPDTGNFFYSHSLTHYNSEPFSHTGVLGTYKGSDDVTWYTGWALGWDTGYDQFAGGNIFVGGLTYNASDDVALTYMVTAGNFGWKSGGEDGFSHHIVGVFSLSECWKYVIQSDYLHTNGTLADNTYENEDKGITNYLFYTMNDCWSLGGRAEWWKSNNVVLGDDISFYHIAGGVNYKPHANVVIRPEIRYDWTPSADVVNNALGVNYDQTWFGIDAVFTY